MQLRKIDIDDQTAARLEAAGAHMNGQSPEQVVVMLLTISGGRYIADLVGRWDEAFNAPAPSSNGHVDLTQTA